MQDYVCINNPLHINQTKMMIKRLNLAEILAQLLVALLLSALIALQSVSAQTTCSSTDIDQDDNGLIEICDLESLNDIRDNPTGSGTVEQGCSTTCTGFELMRDLDFKSTSSYGSGNINTAWTTGDGWEPIANFNATFNGDGYTISNLYINRSSTIGVGLFGSTSGKIDDLGLVNVDISGRSSIGGLAGTNSGTITDSYVSGSVGSVSQPSTGVGGLVGTNSGAITNSCATASVSGLDSWIGGLVGEHQSDATITNSCATGTVSGSRNRIGGLVGYSRSRATITKSYATGSVLGSGSVGGLVGTNDRASITNSYATGSVLGSDSDVGGLVGGAFGASRITNSYATGSVSGGDSNIGGLVGSLTGGMITNSYWLKEAAPMLSDIGDGSSLPYGAERTIEQLTSPTAPGTASTATYFSWLTNVWDFGTSDQFPTIRNSANDILTNLPLCTLSVLADDGDDVKHAMDIDKDNDGLIEVCDIEGLDAIRHQLDGTGYKTTADATVITTGCPGSPSKCKGYELTRSLDFTDNGSYRPATNEATYTVTTSTDVGWQPIGESSSVSFSGIFNGNNYTISNLMINRSTSFVGLFGVINRGEITNLGLLDVNIKGGRATGGLTGAIAGTITSSYATGNVTGSANQTGGLVGFNNGATITNSHATVNVNGNDNVGGLVGTNRGSIEDSYATGNVSRSDNNVGGLAGANQGIIEDSYATGNVSESGDNVGGLAGANQESIDDSYATGNVTESGSSIGGLVGDNNGTITNSYAMGDALESGNNVGGLVGYNTHTITNTYATGDVKRSGSNVSNLVGTNFTSGTIKNSYAIGSASDSGSGGGLAGINFSSLISHSYWLRGSLPSPGGGVDADTEKTAEELKSPIGPGTASTTATYYDWSTADWDFGTSDQFPALKDSDGNLIPGQGTTLTGSSLRESLRELEIPRIRTTSSQIFGVSTNNYVVTIFLPTGTTERSIVLRLKAYNPDAMIQIFKDEDATDYFEGKMSGNESLPIVVGENTKLTIMVDEPDTDYTLTFRVEEILGIKIRVKVFLEGPLQ